MEKNIILLKEIEEDLNLLISLVTVTNNTHATT